MRFTINGSVLNLVPELKIGIVLLTDVDNKGKSTKIHHLLEEISELIKLNFSPAELAKHPMISPWRTVYYHFGSKPTKYKCSVEAMIRRILSGHPIPRINKLVDVCNYLILKHLIPMGCYDLEKIKGNITLTTAKGDERFIPIHTAAAETPDPGEIIYRDDEKVLCRKWNWRDSNETSVTEQTKKAIFFIDALPPVKEEKLKRVCKDIEELAALFCKAKSKTFIADKTKPVIFLKS